MTNDNNRAKEIFIKYSCNHLFIDREIYSEEYKGYKIDRALEEKWRKEFILFWKSRLSVDDFKALFRLRDAWAVEVLPELIQTVNKGDSLAMLWYANTIWQIANGSRISPFLKWRSRKIAIKIWKELSIKPIRLTEQHEVEIENILKNMLELNNSLQSTLDSLGRPNKATLAWATTPDEYIRKYAIRNLSKNK